MHANLIAGLVLLGVTLVMALVGTILVRMRTVRVKNANRFTQLATGIVCAVFYLLNNIGWPGIHFGTIDFWSLFAILAILAYSLIWLAVAIQLNKPEYHQEFGDSFMLSMLFTDSQVPLADTQIRPKAKPTEKKSGTP